MSLRFTAKRRKGTVSATLSTLKTSIQVPGGKLIVAAVRGRVSYMVQLDNGKHHHRHRDQLRRAWRSSEADQRTGVGYHTGLFPTARRPQLQPMTPEATLGASSEQRTQTSIARHPQEQLTSPEAPSTTAPGFSLSPPSWTFLYVNENCSVVALSHFIDDCSRSTKQLPEDNRRQDDYDTATREYCLKRRCELWEANTDEYNAYRYGHALSLARTSGCSALPCAVDFSPGFEIAERSVGKGRRSLAINSARDDA
ncbi:hypothetical protein MTO96_036601 [Rhipicephalus appendiculatus]